MSATWKCRCGDVWVASKPMCEDCGKERPLELATVFALAEQRANERIAELVFAATPPESTEDGCS